MKRVIVLTLLFACCILLCACNDTAQQPETEPITNVEDVNWEHYCSASARAYMWTYYGYLYEVDIPYQGVSVNKVEKNWDGTYTCYGMVRGRSYYGESCSANFSITYEVDWDKAQKIIDNGGVGENPEADSFYDCVNSVDADYGPLKRN